MSVKVFHCAANTCDDKWLKEIKYNQELYKDPKRFIKERKLTKVSLRNHTQDVLCKHVYFIHLGHKLIISSYSWCDYNHSVSLQTDYRMPLWINGMSLLTPDEGNLRAKLGFLGLPNFKQDLQTYKPSELLNFAECLIQAGFELYVSQSLS